MSRQVETAPAAVVEGAGVAVMTEATRPPVVDRGLVALVLREDGYRARWCTTGTLSSRSIPSW